MACLRMSSSSCRASSGPDAAAPLAVYTDIDDDELDSLLTRYDIGRAVDLKGIAEGVENSNFMLQTDRDRKSVV